MVQHQPQPVQQPDPWAGQNHMPGVDPRPLQQPGYQMPMPPVQAGQFNQPFTGSGSKPRKPAKPTTRKSSKGAKGSKGSKGGKGSKGSRSSSGGRAQ